MKSILIEEEIHEMLKTYSKASGIKIKYLVEESIAHYIKYHIEIKDIPEGEKKWT